MQTFDGKNNKKKEVCESLSGYIFGNIDDLIDSREKDEEKSKIYKNTTY